MPVFDQQWQPVPLDTKLFLNVDEDELTEGLAAVENGYIARTGSHNRFPGLIQRIDFGGIARVYLYEWRGDLVATLGDGRMFRINEALTAEDVTGVPISGAGRHVFTETESELVAAAGREIIRFAGDKTEILSENAPLSTHVQYIGGYLVASEANSGRFFHSNLNAGDVWNPIDVFAANSNPDPVTAMLVTPFAELMVAGERSIEQYEQLASGSSTPFFRRWSVGEGVRFPYTMTFADNATWFINRFYEFVRSSGQTSRPKSDDIGKFLEEIDDWSEAWVAPMHIAGHQFIILQIPNATNRLNTTGVTMLFDYSNERWSELYGWDSAENVPARWPGWSYYEIWGRHFVGGNGKLLELDKNTFTNLGLTQRFRIRTGHITPPARVAIENVRLKLRRGTADNTSTYIVRIRVNKDNKGFGRWKSRKLGKAGERQFFMEFGPFGSAYTFQYEIEVTDPVAVAVMALEIKGTAER